MTDTLNPFQPVTDLQLDDRTDINKEKEHLLPFLRTHGVVSVQAEYNGYGDEGGVETITAVRDDNSVVDLLSLTATLGDRVVTLERAVEEFAWNVVQYFHSGFHNNEGGFATLTIHVETGKVEISHDDNIIETVHSENEF